MKLIDVVIIVLIAGILGAVIFYIRKAKKKGIKCIGCPNGATCGGNCAACAGNCGACPSACNRENEDL